MRILVVCGGRTSERVVSLASGDAVATWIKELGHDVWKYDPEKPGHVVEAAARMAPSSIGVDAPSTVGDVAFSPNIVRGLIDVLSSRDIDLVFPILHGGYGEDGTLQALLEWVGMPYTGSGPRSCALAMHKPTAKALMANAGVPVAKGFSVRYDEYTNHEQVTERIEIELGYPVVVKPESGGSTVGLSVVDSAEELLPALSAVREQNDNALIEKLFVGREIAATVIDGQAFPLVEIRPKQGIYDYTNKYTAGRTDYFCPAELSDEMTEKVHAAAAAVFRALDARGFARVDFLVNETGFICLELNSLPGMTATSLVPKSAKAFGLTEKELIAKIIACAWRTVRIPAH